MSTLAEPCSLTTSTVETDLAKSLTETQLQLLIVRWLVAALPDETLIHHSPNEGKRHIRYTKRLIDMGMRPGWPDLELIVPPSAWVSVDQIAPIFLEVKTKTGRLTPAQSEVHKSLTRCAAHVGVVRSIADVTAILAPLVELKLKGTAQLVEQLEQAQAQ